MRKSSLLLLRPFSRGLVPDQASLPYFYRQKPRAVSPTTFKSILSTMNPTGVLYEPIEEVGRMEYYWAGGYHPVAIGDRFHNRYRVVHKLGHGTYSTIWLARDERSHRYVTVKICTADSNSLEIDVLDKLSKPQQLLDLGRTMIPSIFERFNIQGPNGNHLCLVTNPARMSLSDAKNGSWISLVQLEVARALTVQLMIAIQYIRFVNRVFQSRIPKTPC